MPRRTGQTKPGRGTVPAMPVPSLSYAFGSREPGIPDTGSVELLPQSPEMNAFVADSRTVRRFSGRDATLTPVYTHGEMAIPPASRLGNGGVENGQAANTAESNEPTKSDRGIVPVISASNFSNVARGGGRERANAESGESQFKSAEADTGGISYRAAGQYPGRDAEIERLRRLEKNYEKDKAMLAREKAPALARSESHDIGHAEDGGEEFVDLEKAMLKISDNLLDELVRRSGI
jgi:hypothetical protein